MPLSDDEQRRLDEIERALHKDDPTFAASIAMDQVRTRRFRRVVATFVLGVVTLLIGLVVAVGSVTIGIAISIAGFVTMVASLGLQLRVRRR